MATKTKSSKVHLTLKQKADICERSLKAGFDKNKVLTEFSIDRSTLNRILQKKDTFLKTVDVKKSSSAAKQKSFAKGKNFQLEQKLAEWIKLRQNAGYPIAGDEYLYSSKFQIISKYSNPM